MIATFFKKKWSKLIIALVAIFGLFSFLFHNDRFYSVSEEKIGPLFKDYFGVSIFHASNYFANFLDVKGKVKALSNPLTEDDFINITIGPEGLAKLEKGLLSVPRKKKKVAATLTVDGIPQLCRLKFHGTSDNHYQDNKYSYSIKIKKEQTYLNNFRRFKLIKSEEFSPPVFALNKWAQQLGLISSFGEMKMLKINNENQGSYYFEEGISKEFLERNYGITKYAILTNVTDWSRKESARILNHSSDNDLYFGHIEQTNDDYFPLALDKYRVLTDNIKLGNLTEIKKNIDLDYVAKYLALAAITNDVHFMTGDNFKLLYDFNLGKFYPLWRIESRGRDLTERYQNDYAAFNEMLFKSNPFINDEKAVNLKLFKILLKDDEIRALRDQYLYEFVSNKEALINGVQQTISNNEKIMLHTTKSRRAYDWVKQKQTAMLTTTMNLAKEYLSYGHIYGSYDSTSHNLNVLFDAFSPISVYYKNDDFCSKNNIGISLDENLQLVYHYHDLKIDVPHFNPKHLIFVNSITKDTISKKHVHLNHIKKNGNKTHETTAELLDKNHIRYTINNKKLIIKRGVYSIKSDVIIASKYDVLIQKGTVFNMDNAINFGIKGNVTIDGSAKENVVIRNLNSKGSFGSFIIVGQDSLSYANINFLRVSGGNAAYFMGRQSTSQFSIFNSNVVLKNAVFEHSNADDGLNIKYSKVLIDSSKFINNLADQVDLDFCFATISNCQFSPSLIDSNGDGLDLSGSYAKVSNCVFAGFLDKGLSIGEKSRVLVNNCKFNENALAIALKDETTLYSWSNYFYTNKEDYTAFVKKPLFKIPNLYLGESSNELKLNLIEVNKFELDENDIQIEKKRFLTKYKQYRGSSELSNILSLGKIISNY